MFLKRPAARVVLLDRSARIFMVNAEDPLDPFKPAWWEIPGGGIGRGEDSAAAAARELYEDCLLYPNPSPRDVEDGRLRGWG